MKRRLALIVSFVAVLGAASAQEEKTAPALNELEKKFQETLTNADLVGSFSVVGKRDDAPKKEKYHIIKASKVDEERWLIVAKWGKTEVGIPLVLSVKWAGDTPMIQLT